MSGGIIKHKLSPGVKKILRAPKPIIRNVLEKDIERKFVAEAKARGWKTRKLNGMGHKGWCDQLVLAFFGTIELIEFKRPGEDLDPLQDDHHKELRAMGHEPLVMDSWEEAMQYIEIRIDQNRVELSL